MRKASTYYFAVLIITNVLIAWFVSWGCHMARDIFDNLLEGEALPNLTEAVLAHSWWPWVVLAAALVGTILSLATRIRSSLLCHVAFGILVVEALILSLSFAGLLMALYTPTWVLSP